MMNANPGISEPGTLVKPARQAIGLILGGCAVMFLILQGGLTWLTGKIDATIWAPVLLHVAAHAIRLVDIPDASYMTAVIVWLVLQLATPFLVFALRGNLLKPQV